MNNSKRKKYSRKRSLILIFAGLWVFLIFGCNESTKSGPYHIGILVETPALGIAAEGFTEKMTALGYREGENVIYDVKQANGDPAKARSITEDFVQKPVDLIFAFSTIAVLEAKTIMDKTDIPLVFTIVNIEDTHIVKSVREPGGNITGVRSPAVELPLKNLEIMRQILPGLKRVYVPYAANHPAIHSGLIALRQTAQSSGITLVESPITTLDELQADLSARESRGDSGIQAIICLPETLVQTAEGFAILSSFAMKHKIPIGGLIPWEIQQGALYTTGIDMREMGELAAPLADKVLRGTQAGSIPLVSPELHLHINYKLALELGLTIPEGLLLQASEIIR